MQIGNIVVKFSAVFAFIAGLFIIIVTAKSSEQPTHALIVVSRNLSALEYSYANASFRRPVVTMGTYGGCRQDFFGILDKCPNGNASAAALPEYTARSILRVPSRHVVGLTIASGALTLFFAFFWAIGVFADWKPQKEKTRSYIFEYIPFLAFVLGIIPYLSIYSLATKICHDFNSYHEFQVKIGKDNNQGNFVATLGPGFLWIWLAYGLIFHSITVFWVRVYQTITPPAAAPAPGGSNPSQA